MVEEPGLPAAPRTLVTGELNKLPAEYQLLLDPDRPVPSGVRYFPEVITIGGLFWTVVLGLALVSIGLVLIAGGVLILFILPIVGLVFVLAGLLLLYSTRGRRRLMRRQRDGDDVRQGVFLTSDAIMVRTDVDYTIIPRARFAGLDDHRLCYDLDGQPKWLMLPADLVRADTSQMLDAIEQWSKAGES